ncbi:hypothetical protein N7468_006948 [Penicillium chermesinum]|uniref:Uncharacterized protein n=1 Tax=Penicillium chermesinum TaxID=63820 RepID=A0A9W9TK68_9EURO|nr:uncharacterized protein N7468_006948 [Penicillium chermesinum]KAJ5225723.1 hypothetical protein N7468_006948 [Penicillium chermesinum]
MRSQADLERILCLQDRMRSKPNRKNGMRTLSDNPIFSTSSRAEPNRLVMRGPPPSDPAPATSEKLDSPKVEHATQHRDE